MHKQKLIFGIVIFFLANSFFYGFTLVGAFDLYPDNNLCTGYHLEDMTATVGYNILTATEEIEYYSNSYNDQSFQKFILPNIPVENPQISYVFPPDDRAKVTSTSSYPWSTICKLYITSANQSLFIGSGAMLDEFHILTCGHCVYIHDYGGWVDEIQVVPGMAGSYTPFGIAYATYLRTYTEWTELMMVEHDWAVVTLDRNIGEQTGWMGRMTADPSDSLYTGVLNTAGYPGDLDFGEYMYFDSDNGDRADEYNHWFWMDSAGGQSGSPVWVYNGTHRFIVSILAYEYLLGTDANFGTRLNQDKYDQINAWLAADAPPDNSNGADPTLITIIIIVAIIGVAVLIVSIVLISRRSRSKAEIAKAYEGDIPPYGSEQTPLITPQFYSQSVRFCPNCGRQLFRNTQQFCSNCGFDLSNESLYGGNGGGL